MSSAAAPIDTPAADASPARSSRSMIPAMPRMSVITSFFSSPAAPPPACDADDTGHSTSANPVNHSSHSMPSPTDSADPRFNFKHVSTQASFMSENGTETPGQGKRREPRPKTSFGICQPPPKKSSSKRQVHIRARPVLQLHRLEAHGRPKPALQVLPSSFFSTRLSKAVNKVSGAKHNLGPIDMAIVKADEYHTREASAASDDDEPIEIVAVISGLARKEASTPNSAVRIILADGAEWDGVRLPNGGYECCTSDVHGLKQTVRWVYKKKSPRPATSDPQLDQNVAADKKFKFSTISPNSRRHPVIASLTSANLDIFDSYTPPSSTVPSSAVSSSAMSSSVEDNSPFDQTGEAIATTDQLRNLITASAVWVALCENRLSGSVKDAYATRSPSFKSISTSRSFTMSTPPVSPSKRAVTGPKSSDASSNAAPRSVSLRQTFQRAPSLLRRQIMGRTASSSTELAKMPASVASSESVNSHAPSQNVSAAAAPHRTRARADTTSTVLINENAAGCQWHPDFEQDMHEADCEEDEGSDGTGDEAGETATMRERSRTRDPKKPTSSVKHSSGDTSRSTSAGEGTVCAKDAQPSLVLPPPKKKSRVVRALFCGMV